MIFPEIEGPTTTTKESEQNQPKSRISDTEDSADAGVGLVDWDSERNHSNRLVKWIIEERRRRKVERSMLDLYRRRINHERSNLEKEKQDFASAEDDLARRITQVKDLLPIADEMKRLGLDFTIANSWITCVKEMSQRKGMELRSAAWKLAGDLKAWQELGGFKTAISNAKHQLSLLQRASENQKSAIAALVDLKKSGVSGNELLQLIKTVNERKVNGSRGLLLYSQLEDQNHIPF